MIEWIAISCIIVVMIGIMVAVSCKAEDTDYYSTKRKFHDRLCGLENIAHQKANPSMCQVLMDNGTWAKAVEIDRLEGKTKVSLDALFWGYSPKEWYEDYRVVSLPRIIEREKKFAERQLKMIQDAEKEVRDDDKNASA